MIMESRITSFSTKKISSGRYMLNSILPGAICIYKRYVTLIDVYTPLPLERRFWEKFVLERWFIIYSVCFFFFNIERKKSQKIRDCDKGRQKKYPDEKCGL